MIDPCLKFLVENQQVAGSKLNKRHNFFWRDDQNIPALDDAKTPEHLALLKKYKIPFIADIHCHFFPEHTFKLIWRYFDANLWPIAYRQTLSERLKSLRKNQIIYFTTLNYAHKTGMAEELNQWVYESLPNWPGAIPFGTFYPDEDALRYVQKAVEQFKFKGFKLHCQVSKLELDDVILRPVFAYLEERQIPIVIHTGTAPVPGKFTGVNFFAPLMKRFQNLKVICAHMGAYEIIEYIQLSQDYENLYLDTTMIFVDYIFAEYEYHEILTRINNFSERIFFGTDFPNIPYNLAHAASVLLKADLSREAKQNIFFRNFLRLFNLSEP